MCSYSSDELNKEWRFLIDKDFVDTSGHDFTYADDGLQQWGDETLSVKFVPETSPHGPRCAAISDDGKYIAVGAKFDVAVYDVEKAELIHQLQGHLSEVNCLAFRPGKSSQLVSAAMANFGDAKKADPQIIFWDLAQYTPNIHATPAAVERLARNAANNIIAEIKSVPSNVQVSANDQKTLAKSLEPSIRHLVVSKGVGDDVKLSGRLQGGFQSQIFKPSGDLMFYMPGKSPRSNDSDNWELRLRSIDKQEDALVLTGHEDVICWTGYNHDETLIGTASWDKTFIVWDAKTGKPKHVFITATQNWTAGFSKDGKYFAGTSGDDKLHVYSLKDGSKHVEFDAGKHWSRTLSWHPSGHHIALGGDPLGKLFVVDIESNKAIQHRKLSTAVTRYPDKKKCHDPAKGFLSVYNVYFVDDGRKLAFFTAGDGSAEVYDMELGQKWRFARSGTMNPPDDDSEVTSKSGYHMTVLEDHENKRVLLMTVDFDAVRLWAVPMSS